MTIPHAGLRAPTALDTGCLVLAAALWGSSFLCIEIALADFPPLAIAGYRVALAALLVLIVVRLRGLALPSDTRSHGLFLAIGLSNGALPFTLIGWGQLHVDPATASLLIACSPFATLALSHAMTRDDRFGWRRLGALALGFSGVALLLGRGALEGGGSLGGMLAIALAACSYALSGVLIRRLGSCPSLVVVAGTLVASALVLSPLVLWRHPPWHQEASATTLAAVGFLALGPTALAYVLRTRVVQHNGAVFMSGAGYLIPPFAMLWAWLFLGERPGATAASALGLILGGLALGRRGAREGAARAAGESGSGDGRAGDGRAGDGGVGDGGSGEGRAEVGEAGGCGPDDGGANERGVEAASGAARTASRRA